MAEAGVSRSATNVALARAHLTWLGVVDDPHAEGMLPPDRQRMAAALRLPGLRVLGLHSSFPYLAARTLFFDRFVADALAAGVRQVAVVAAGYDSRAWRLARPGVTFFEIDRPATQEDKRARAPAGGGPVYVPADVTGPGLVGALAVAGHRPDEPTAFLAEGLIIYLAREDAAALLARLAEVAAPGSRLAVSCETGFQHQRFNRRFARRYYRRRGEPMRFRLPRSEAEAFLAAAGWSAARLHAGADLDAYLRGTRMAGRLGDVPGAAYIVSARREGPARGVSPRS
ncbi:MAG TPA: SAM-dependent methyltransferase [Acidimicrobiales bacterium]|nr:SAM-dependent methyltransferase [Acidimicrobiales bacterium]